MSSNVLLLIVDVVRVISFVGDGRKSLNSSSVFIITDTRLNLEKDLPLTI